jgi:predicted transcriptional regulator
MLSVRLSTDLKMKLDRIAVALRRPRSWLIKRALEDYVAAQAWQTQEMQIGLAAADAGDLATSGELKAAFDAFRHSPRMDAPRGSAVSRDRRPHRRKRS